jgi:hypothetical protein
VCLVVSLAALELGCEDPADQILARRLAPLLGNIQGHVLDPHRLLGVRCDCVPAPSALRVVPGQHLLGGVHQDELLLAVPLDAEEVREDPAWQLLREQLAEVAASELGHLVDELDGVLMNPVVDLAHVARGKRLRRDPPQGAVLTAVHR